MTPSVDRDAPGDSSRPHVDRRHAANGPLPFHPVLFTVTATLQFALATGVDIRASGRALIVALLGSLIVLAATWAVTRRRHLAGLLVDAFLLLLLVPGIGLVVVVMARVLSPPVLAAWLLALVAIVALVLRITWRLTRRWTGAAATAQLNRAAIVLLVAVIATGFVNGTATQVARELGGPDPQDSDGSGRDVIVVLMDGYPRADTLERLFGFDNGQFIQDLESLGFAVAAKSRTNYTRTEMTLASMLHMKHLMDIPDYRRIVAGDLGEQPAMRNLINENPVFDQFRSQGYSIVTVAPGIERVTIRSSDAFVDSGTVNELEFHILRSTALGWLVSRFAPDWLAAQHRERVLSSLTTIEEIGSQPRGGRLVLGHVLSPHMPAVFHADGSLRAVEFSPFFFEERPEARGETDEQYIGAFTAQLEYLNRRVLGVVTRIARANPEAVVVLLSDHGSRLNFDWDDSNADTDERFANFLAIRSPGEDDLLPDGSTLVNLFPAILNAYFGTEIDAVPDRTYNGVVVLEEIPNPDAYNSDGAGS